MNYHIGFASEQKNAVIIKQEGYEDKVYTLEELNILYNALVANERGGRRLPVVEMAMDMLLKYQVDEDDVEEATEEAEEVMDYDV